MHRSPALKREGISPIGEEEECSTLPLPVTKRQAVSQICSGAPITNAHIAVSFHTNYLPCPMEKFLDDNNRLSDKPHKCLLNPNCHIYFVQIWRSALSQVINQVLFAKFYFAFPLRIVHLVIMQLTHQRTASFCWWRDILRNSWSLNMGFFFACFYHLYYSPFHSPS
jgi:hypothetical protein